MQFASLVLSSVIIARLLGVDGRGLIAAAVLVPTIVAFAGELGLPTATGYLIGEGRLNRRAVIGTARTLAFGLSAALILVSVVLTLSRCLWRRTRAGSRLRSRPSSH